MDRLESYKHKCQILRQIQSNKALQFRTINAAQNIAVVVVSSFLMFIGFSGQEKIYKYVNWVAPMSLDKVEFLFNFLVFVLFVLAILHLVFRFGEKQAQSERAIVLLTHLINEIDDIRVRNEEEYSRIKDAEVERIRQKYDSYISIIPSNSDAEFNKAREDWVEKAGRKSEIPLRPQDMFDGNVESQMVKTVIRKSEFTMQILSAIRKADDRLYVGGGLVRNLIWDHLHGFAHPTPCDDVDVVYFDTLSNLKNHDEILESKLKGILPNLRWSVKNQARMHIVNSEEQYKSLEEAISKWPETATAIAARLNAAGDIEITAPHGLSDLFRLIVRATPAFRRRESRIRERVKDKRWKETWPKLEVFFRDDI